LNPTAIFSKTGKGVQEASGKTSALSRADRAVLKEIDGKTALANIAVKFEKIPADKFDALIQQFDKDGYIREVSSGSQAAAAPPARSAAPSKAAPPPADSGSDEALDFTQAIKLPPKAPAAPAAPKPPPVDLAAAARAESDRNAKDQEVFDYKARAEAEAKAKAEAKARTEADAKVRAAGEAAVRMATEVKARAEAEGKAKVDAAAGREREALEKARRESEDKARLEAELTGKLEEERRARKELEETAKRDAEQLHQRLEAEMKAKLEEERKAREAEDRKRREEDDRRRAEEDRKRREEDERRRKEDEERRAKEQAERRARDEEDRKRREEDERRRKEEAEQRAKEAEERRAREEADRKRREDRRRAEEEKRRKEGEERRAKEEAEAKARAAQSASAQFASAQSASASASMPSIQPVAAPPSPPPPAADGGLGDSLLADLDSFGQREEEEQKAKEEAERKAKEAAARKAKEEAERRAKDDAERRAKEEAERKRREEEERKAKEEAEQRAREEEERQQQEEAERKRKAKEALAAKEAERKAAQRAATAKDVGKDDDIGVTDDDLGMDDVKKDEKALSATARKAAREREQAPVAAAAARRPMKWGKPAAIALCVLLVGGVGALHVMPLPTEEYEKAASDAMGVPVTIKAAKLWLITGIEVRFKDVSVGAIKNLQVRGFPELGSLFDAKKSFSRMELEGVSLSQSQLADAVLGKVSGENFRVGRVVIKQAKLDGPLALPALDVDATVSGDGSLQSVSLRGGDKLSVQLSPKGNDIGFEISAGSLALPFVPALSLSDFGMKGTANRGGVTMSEFDGRAFDGVISGSAKIRWGANWLVDGEVRARGVKVAVIAPALVSEGKVDGRGAYTMSGPNPATLFESARIQGEFKIEKGVLGSFDLTRALQTGGAQTGGRTIFTELTGQAVYDKGTVKVSNVAIAAGAMNAGASLDIDANGGLSGRIVADVKTPNQTLRATLNVSGKIQDPVIRK
jgi:hypothetical protein